MTDQDTKMITIAVRLIDVEMLEREEDNEDDSPIKSYTPQETKALALKIYSQYK